MQWDILVRSPDNKLQALTDLTAWLLENGFTFYLAKEDGKDLVLLGPFASKAEAEARQVQLQERLVKKKKTDAESLVIEHKARRNTVVGGIRGSRSCLSAGFRFTGPTNSLPRPITQATV